MDVWLSVIKFEIAALLGILLLIILCSLAVALME